MIISPRYTQRLLIKPLLMLESIFVHESTFGWFHHVLTLKNGDLQQLHRDSLESDFTAPRAETSRDEPRDPIALCLQASRSCPCGRFQPEKLLQFDLRFGGFQGLTARGGRISPKLGISPTKAENLTIKIGNSTNQSSNVANKMGI